MKPTLMFVALSMVFATPSASARTELELLRAKCAEQERQIQQLEQENSRLRIAPAPSRPLGGQTEMISTSAAKPLAVPAAAAPDSATYTVKAGDSFEKIARDAGSTPVIIAKMNGLKRDAMIHPGQKLKVPASAATTAAPERTPTPSATSSNRAGQTHTVKSGETYYSIAGKYKVSVASLVAANPKVKPTAMRAGQVIRLSTQQPAAPATAPAIASSSSADPAPNAKTSAQADSSPPSTRQNAVADDVPAPAPEKKITPVTIDGEMTYGDFAAKYGTDTDRLNALNGLDLNNTTVLAKGSELYVPIARP